MIDVRCKNCNKTLLKANILVGAIKCNRCKMIFEYYVTSNALYETNDYNKKPKDLQKHEHYPIKETESQEEPLSA